MKLLALILLFSLSALGLSGCGDLSYTETKFAQNGSLGSDEKLEPPQLESAALDLSLPIRIKEGNPLVLSFNASNFSSKPYEFKINFIGKNNKHPNEYFVLPTQPLFFLTGSNLFTTQIETIDRPDTFEPSYWQIEFTSKSSGATLLSFALVLLPSDSPTLTQQPPPAPPLPSPTLTPTSTPSPTPTPSQTPMPVPLPNVSGVPSDNSNLVLLSFWVTAPGLERYKYKIGPSAATFCTLDLGYSAARTVQTAIAETLSGIPDGQIRLCVAGLSADSAALVSSSVLDLTWSKDTVAPEAPWFEEGDNYTKNPLQSIWFTLFPAESSTEPVSLEIKVQKTNAEGNYQDIMPYVPYLNTEYVNNINLEDSSNYRLVARSIDSAGNHSNESYSWDWQLDNTPPTTPSNLTTGPSPDSLYLRNTPLLTFNDSSDGTGSGISHYLLEIRRASNATLVLSKTFSAGSGASGIQINNATDFMTLNETYYGVIVAIDMTGNQSLAANFPPWGASPGGIICPTNFLIIAPKAPYTSNYFCVSKFEMKILGQADGNQIYDNSFVPESHPAGTPWTKIKQNDALTECQSLGTGFDLISNNQWQTLAQEIEILPQNWTSGIVGTEILYRGNSDGQPSLSVINTNDSYDQTNNNASQSLLPGKDQRRIFYLKTGEPIWDLAGNVEEWTKDSLGYYLVGEGVHILEFSDAIHTEQSPDGRTIRQQYGASTAYPTLAATPHFGGFGYFFNLEPNPLDYQDADWYWEAMMGWHSATARGNSSLSPDGSVSLPSGGVINGLFNATNTNSNSTTIDRGFRCVWSP